MRISKTLICAALLSVFATATFAQAPLEPPQLPSRTVFYLVWRGAPAVETRNGNALLSLWDDPGFAPVRSAITDSFLSEAKSLKPASDPATKAAQKQTLEDFGSLLENPFEVGYIGAPKRASAAASTAHPWNGFFLIYNRAGKEELLSKALARMRAKDQANPSDPARISEITIGGVSALKIERKSETTYWIEDGKYALSGGEPAVLEDVLSRLKGKALNSATLDQTPAFQEARPILGEGPIEFFFRVPDLKDLPLQNSAAPPNIRVDAILDALKLDAIHSICGRINFEGARTHLQAAVLGDPAPGSLFDIVPDGTTMPASASFLSADTVYYNTSRINFLGIYNTVKRIAGAFFPKGQEGNVVMFEALGQTRIGRPIPEALALFTGEFASLQNSPALDQKKQIYFLGIQNKPEVLKLLRTVLADKIASERNEGDATYLKVSLAGAKSSAGSIQYNFFNVAVTPDSILAGSRTEAIREILAKRSAAPAWPPAALNARTQFPQTLVGFNFVDLQRVDWAAVKENWRQELAKANGKNALNETTHNQKTTAPSPKLPALFDQVDPQTFARHLHFASSASWKDNKGIHFEQWLD